MGGYSAPSCPSFATSESRREGIVEVEVMRRGRRRQGRQAAREDWRMSVERLLGLASTHELAWARTVAV